MKPEAYQKQLIIYLNNKSYGQAYDLARQYLAEYPDDMVAHFLLAKSALWAEKYEEAALEARKAFNLARNEADMVMCAVHACIAYYRLQQYGKGFELLKSLESVRTCEETEQLAFLFSLAIGNDWEARRHFDSMMNIDSDAAMGFLQEVAEGAQIDYEKLVRKTDRITY
ncbi:tetratricopeptide repeat protein [Candidatus Micrarchaeota archaeon]|nr:tetratricopeptide repeat protein [Candidatus Micrarchaeota archaeon]